MNLFQFCSFFNLLCPVFFVFWLCALCLIGRVNTGISPIMVERPWSIICIYLKPLLQMCVYTLLLCFICLFAPQLSVGAHDDFKGKRLPGETGNSSDLRSPTMAAVKVTMTAEENGGFRSLFYSVARWKDENKGNKPDAGKEKLFHKTTQAAMWYFKPVTVGAFCVSNVSIF